MYTLQVEKMSCGHCVNAVTKAVQTVDAQATLQVDLAQKKVDIQSSAPIDQITAAIVDAGYPVVSSTSY